MSALVDPSSVPGIFVFFLSVLAPPGFLHSLFQVFVRGLCAKVRSKLLILQVHYRLSVPGMHRPAEEGCSRPGAALMKMLTRARRFIIFGQDAPPPPLAFSAGNQLACRLFITSFPREFAQAFGVYRQVYLINLPKLDRGLYGPPQHKYTHKKTRSSVLLPGRSQ